MAALNLHGQMGEHFMHECWTCTGHARPACNCHIRRVAIDEAVWGPHPAASVIQTGASHVYACNVAAEHPLQCGLHDHAAATGACLGSAVYLLFRDCCQVPRGRPAQITPEDFLLAVAGFILSEGGVRTG